MGAAIATRFGVPGLSDEVLRLPPTIREFEPRPALDGGEDGLRFLRPIVAQAPVWLEPEGLLAVEIGFDQGLAVQALFREVGFGDVVLNKDYGSRDRVVSGRWIAQVAR